MTAMLRALPMPFLLLTGLALSGCSSEEFDGTVEVDDDSFDPTSVDIAADSEIHFEVAATAQHPHTITIHKAGDAASTLLLNQTVRAGDDAHFRFQGEGTYHVWCQFHGTMTTGMHMVVEVG